MVHSQSSKQAPYDGQPYGTLDDSLYCIQTLAPIEQIISFKMIIVK